MQFQLPKGLAAAGPYWVTPSVAGTASRERLILVWARPESSPHL
jgi:hypothetical protein